MSTGGGVDKEVVVHTYNGILLSHKKEWNNAICSNVDGPRNQHTKWSKSQTEGQISYDTTYMWNVKKWYKWTYLQNRNRLTDIDNKLTLTRRERERHKLGVWDWQTHTTIYKINNKNLRYSTGNYIQYIVVTIMEKNLKKNIYIYVHV